MTNTLSTCDSFSHSLIALKWSTSFVPQPTLQGQPLPVWASSGEGRKQHPLPVQSHLPATKALPARATSDLYYRSCLLPPLAELICRFPLGPTTHYPSSPAAEWIAPTLHPLNLINQLLCNLSLSLFKPIRNLVACISRAKLWLFRVGNEMLYIHSALWQK